MNGLVPVDAAEMTARLLAAIRDRSRLTVYWRRETAMCRGHTSLLAGDQEAGLFWIEPPVDGTAPGETVGPVVGQMVGLCMTNQFRKVVFDAETVGPQDLPDADGRPRTALAMRWPESMHEFQRRLYSRARVPHRMTVPVDLVRLEPGALPSRGLLQDLSVSGLGMTLTAGRHGIRYRPGEEVSCRFLTNRDGPPETVRGRIRYCEQVLEGSIRLGVEFENLLFSPEGQALLARLSEAVEGYRRTDARRRRRSR